MSLARKHLIVAWDRAQIPSDWQPLMNDGISASQNFNSGEKL
jgi:hypothetical protein